MKMSDFHKALLALRPGVNFSNLDDTLAGVRWDAPLPDGFAPPTQQEVDAELARQKDPVPSEVYALQFRRALRSMGKIDAVNAWVAQQSDEVQEAWEYATKISYGDALVTDAALLLGIDKDRLFRKAATY